MKMSREITSCCVVLLLSLTSVFGAQRKLISIRDVHLPTDILILLRWFANEVNIDNDVIRLNFASGEYGSHHYGNYEGMLEQPPLGYQYNTIGNINEASSYSDHPWTWHAGQNKARIIFSVREENLGYRAQRIVDRVYITRHYDRSSRQDTSMYDPGHTYEVTINFLRQIRGHSITESQQIAAGYQFRNTSAAHLQGHHYNQHSYIPQSADESNFLCYIVPIVIILAIVFVFFALRLHVNK